MRCYRVDFLNQQIQMVKNRLSVILEANKLTGSNYTNWLRNLKIVLDSKKRAFVLIQTWKTCVVMDNNLYIDLIIQSLPSSFEQFVMNFSISKLNVTVNELVHMLVIAEFTMKKDKMVLVASISKARKCKMGKKKEKFF
ncbi:hypothetical protein CDL12_04091 [Handroanthus impetiginosus]|uniref:Uncharacterized protein n=1 Tax=Handroanthus impetiginosus TaxID=429701 RepID=A0A2G9I0A0_9LAMI|nr:hypothetical protein CDL12_04091 [Handroanthus impetiginosus]